VEEAFALELARVSSRVLATAPPHDEPAVRVWRDAGAALETLRRERPTDLGSIQTLPVFRGRPAPQRESDGASSSSRRRARGASASRLRGGCCARARRGVAFDEMAVLVRAPAHYLGLLEHALARGERAGQLRAWHAASARGWPRIPGAAGVRREGLSANRFAEYLSLGQLPEAGAPPAAVGAAGRRAVRGLSRATRGRRAASRSRRWRSRSEDQPEIAGTLRTPRRWEWMLVEAAVIGGDPERWRRRLRGFAAELQVRLAESRRSRPGVVAHAGA
jgi:hypothetical protein